MRSTSLYKGFQPQAAHRQDHPGQIRHTDHWPLLGTLAHLSEARRSPSGICEPHAQGARSPVDLLVPGHQSLGIHWTHAPGALMHMPQGKWLLHASSCWLLPRTSPPSFQSLSWNICNHVWPTSTAHLHHMFICNVLANFSLCNCYTPIVFSRHKH